MSKDKVANRRIVIVTVVLCIILAISLMGVIINYTSIIASKDSQFSSLTSLISHAIIHDAVLFLESMYNSTIGLIAEAPRVAPSTYWLVSDNLWAFKALEKYDLELSNAIRSRLIELAEAYNLPANSQGLPISYKHEAVIGDAVPIPFNETVSYTLYRNDYTLKTDIANGTSVKENWQGYADLLLYATLSRHWEGKDDEAIALFNMAKDMWNGSNIGISYLKCIGQKQ